MSEILSNEEKKKMYSLFHNMIKEDVKIDKNQNSDILIVDGMNTFIRAYAVSPEMNADGVHMGGMSGFLKSIGYAIKLLNPTRCVIVFDGAGGSLKRRKIYPDYKKRSRNKIRLNRAYSEDIPVDEDGMKKQLFRLVQYIDCLPVTTMAIDNIEADDAIAYAALDYFKNSNIYIMSSDKDFLQLVDDRVKVWSPTKKKLYGKLEVVSEYGIDSGNFVYYRTMDGDVSDNINGIPGAGLKTIKKCFPMLSENKKITMEEIYNHCENNKAKFKLYSTILENKITLERNYQLMQLNDTQIQSFSQLRINEILDKPITKLNRVGFLSLMREDKIQVAIPNSATWLTEVFGKLDHFIKS